MKRVLQSDSSPNRKRVKSSVHWDGDFSSLLERVYKRANTDIVDYKSAQIWRSAFRMALERSIQAARVLVSALETVPESWSRIFNSYNNVVNGTTVKILTNVQQSETDAKLTIEAKDKSYETGVFSEHVIEQVAEFINAESRELAHERLREEAARTLHLTDDNFKTELEPHWSEALMFVKADTFRGNRIYSVMEYWPYDEDEAKLNLYKQLWETDSDKWFFNYAIGWAKNHTPYLRFLICEYAVKDSDKLRYGAGLEVPNITALRFYHEAFQKIGMSNSQLAKCTVTGSCFGDKHTIEETKEMLEFLWSLPDSGLPEQKTAPNLMQWLKTSSRGNKWDAIKQFIHCGYINWDQAQLLEAIEVHNSKLQELKVEEKAHQDFYELTASWMRPASYWDESNQIRGKREDLEYWKDLIVFFVQYHNLTESHPKVLEWMTAYGGFKKKQDVVVESDSESDDD